MRIIGIILFVVIFTMASKAQTVYFYTTGTNLIQNVGVKIYFNGNLITKIRENSWVKYDMPSVKEATFKFKSGTYFSSKSITINFSQNNVTFVKIQLQDMGWRVYEQSYPNVPSVILNDYQAQQSKIETRNRLANHPVTTWTEKKLKTKFITTTDEIEGIYENSYRSESTPRYKVGLIQESGFYKLIYLSGGDPKVWREGDIKAILIRTATPYLFKAKWYMGDKTLNDEGYLSFSDGIFSAVFSNGVENLYIKMFPTSSGLNETNTAPTSGTGFALSREGYIVTNYHVVENRNKIKIKGIDGDFNSSYSAQTIAKDKNNDLAILKINDPNFSSINNIPYNLNLKVIDVGSSVFALGYPLRTTMGDEVKLTNGIISSKSGFQGDITTYQISVPLQPGNSGGPLFDNKGNVIGIVNAKHSNTDNVSYAIKTIYLNDLIQSLEISPTELSQNFIKDHTLAEQVKIVKNFIYIVEGE